MNRFLSYLGLSVLFCVGACSSNSAEETLDDVRTLPVPEVSVTVDDLKANVRWSISEQVTNVRFTYEFYEGESASPQQSATTRYSSHDFDLEEGVDYRVRVRATAPVGTTAWRDSEFSDFVSFSSEAVEPDPDDPDDPNPGDGSMFGLPLANENDGVVRAFPGAEGGGMYTTGGRGGKVYHVTKLSDDGSVGTLRHAISQSGARTVVFDVCGTIRLTKTLEIKHGDLTIAGQTAPGDGICLRDYSVQVKASNVIIRYLRFRMGDAAKEEDDAIWGRYNDNLILDHCTMSWSTDECASFYANRNFTMQWCLLSESLRNSIHGKGKHGYGGLWGGRNASFHHNLLADHDSRNARIDHPGIYDSYLSTHRGNVDLRNNVIYNWGDNSTYGGEDGSYNLVGNYYKPGPASKQRKYFVDAYWYNSSSEVGSAYPRLYLEGNYHAGSYASALNADNWNGGVSYHDQSKYGENPSTSAGHLTAPLPIRADDATTCYTTTHTAADAFEKVLSLVGASLSRDAVDERVTSEARSGVSTCVGSNGSTGGLIDTQEDAGGWPELTATDEQIARVATDTDGDGIPDYYEELFGLDKNDAADGNRKTLDPQGLYTNLEVYLHYLVRDITEAQVAGGTYKALN